MPLNYKHILKSRNSAARQDQTLGLPYPAASPRCGRAPGALGCPRDAGLLHPASVPEGGRGLMGHAVFGLYSSASILPGLVTLGIHRLQFGI